MVFVIQAAQNRDGAAVQTKLDEILRAIEGADDRMIAIEEDTSDALDEAKKHLREIKDQS